MFDLFGFRRRSAQRDDERREVAFAIHKNEILRDEVKRLSTDLQIERQRCQAQNQLFGETSGLQSRMRRLVETRFGEASAVSVEERIDRVIEETCELAQAEGHTLLRIIEIALHVFAQEAGEPTQELGGLGATLLAYAAAKDLVLLDVIRTELNRIEALSISESKRKNRAKIAAGISRDFSALLPNPWEKATWNMTRQAELIARNPSLAESFMQAAGVLPFHDQESGR